MGKWTDIVKKKNLPRLGEEPSYQAKIDARKAELVKQFKGKLTIKVVTDLYIKARLAKEAVEEQLYLANLELTACEQLALDNYEAQDIDSLRLESGELMTRTIEPYASVKDKVVYHAWCVKQGLGEMMTLPWQTTNKMVKDALETGQPNPPGVDVFHKAKLVWRRVKETQDNG